MLSQKEFDGIGNAFAVIGCFAMVGVVAAVVGAVWLCVWLANHINVSWVNP